MENTILFGDKLKQFFFTDDVTILIRVRYNNVEITMILCY